MKKIIKKILTGTIALSAAATFLTAPVSAGWVKDTGGWWYQNEDKSFQKGGFQFTEGKWYYFDQNGYIKTGWVKDGGEWYYMDASGVMQTGWVMDGNKWYYFSEDDSYGLPDGAMHIGYLTLDESIYLLGADGAMVTGEYDDGLSKTTFGADGKLQETSSEGAKINFEAPAGWKSIGGGEFQTLMREDDLKSNIILVVYEGSEEKLDATTLKTQSADLKKVMESIGCKNVVVTAKMLTGSWDVAAQFSVKANLEIDGVTTKIRNKIVVMQQNGLTGAVNLTTTEPHFAKYEKDFDKMITGITLEKTNQKVAY